MKKVAAALLIISLLFTLAACGEKRVYKKVDITPFDVTETESVTEEEATTEPESETETETESETESATATTGRSTAGRQPSSPTPTRHQAPVGGNNPSTTRAQTPEVPTADMRPTVPSDPVPATVSTTNVTEAAEPSEPGPETPTNDDFYGE
ncbi:MAG: hypothetical protein J1F23_03825 [Oscillospiraceae bacterium]|nr:hypothetical protein [Oscillospiraceae bacterium]